jgi:hypothetical protein
MHDEEWEERLDDWLDNRQNRPQHGDLIKYVVAAVDRLDPLAAARQSSVFEMSLEKRLMAYLAEYNGQRAEHPTAAPGSSGGKLATNIVKIGQRASQMLRTRHRVTRAAIAAALLLSLLGGTIVLAQRATPGSIFYGLHQFGQNLQVGLAQSNSDRARIEIGYALASLHTLEGAISTGDHTSFAADLTDFQTQYDAATKAVSALPDGAQRSQLETQVASVSTQATTVLYEALTGLTWKDRLATTSAIAKLGHHVLTIKSVTFGRGSGASGNGASGGAPDAGDGLLIHIHGFGFEKGAKVYVNGRQAGIVHSVTPNDIQVELAGVTSLNLGTAVGVSNPDGTATQITLSHRSDSTSSSLSTGTPDSHINTHH